MTMYLWMLAAEDAKILLNLRQGYYYNTVGNSGIARGGVRV